VGVTGRSSKEGSSSETFAFVSSVFVDEDTAEEDSEDAVSVGENENELCCAFGGAHKPIAARTSPFVSVRFGPVGAMFDPSSLLSASRRRTEGQKRARSGGADVSRDVVSPFAAVTWYDAVVVMGCSTYVREKRRRAFASAFAFAFASAFKSV
jgi:hypothetical protein